MNDEEKKAWEALVNASTVGYGNDELKSWKEVDIAILAADAELTALRSRLSLAEKVVEIAKLRPNKMGPQYIIWQGSMDLALRARDAGKEG